jgi:hypothetical protein
MKFLAFEENGGAFHWAIVAASRDRLVQSASFASCEEATLAAGIVRCGAGSVPFEDRADDIPPLELAARRETATVRDDLDVERWLDERGSFNSEAVTGWPSRRRSHRPSGWRPAPARIRDKPIAAQSAGTFCACRVSDVTARTSSSPRSEQTNP